MEIKEDDDNEEQSEVRVIRFYCIGDGWKLDPDYVVDDGIIM
jgi:hypothetical protein